MGRKNRNYSNSTQSESSIPDIFIIDLDEDDFPKEEEIQDEATSPAENSEPVVQEEVEESIEIPEEKPKKESIWEAIKNKRKVKKDDSRGLNYSLLADSPEDSAPVAEVELPVTEEVEAAVQPEVPEAVAEEDQAVENATEVLEVITADENQSESQTVSSDHNELIEAIFASEAAKAEEPVQRMPFWRRRFNPVSKPIEASENQELPADTPDVSLSDEPNAQETVIESEQTEESLNIPAENIPDTTDEAQEDAQVIEEPEIEIDEEIDFFADEDELDVMPKKDIKEILKKYFMNIHMLLLAIFLIFVVCVVVKFKNWGTKVDTSDIHWDGVAEYMDALDYMSALKDANGLKADMSNIENIVLFGNSPFSDDRDSSDGIAKMLEKETGANVYNCSVSGSYLACQWPYFNSAEDPMDAYCLYWLTVLAATKVNSAYFDDAKAALGEEIPPEAEEVVDTLINLDFNDVDVVVIMYDASDYLMGHNIYSDLDSTDVQQFTGNLEASIELLHNTYPNVRIIVSSPTYAYAINSAGEYVSSDMFRYEGLDVLSTYMIKECESSIKRDVTFIDNLYVTVTEANADQYLTDNLHLNLAGRRRLLDRILYAINYYNQVDEPVEE